jgi:hypothetical protein
MVADNNAELMPPSKATKHINEINTEAMYFETLSCVCTEKIPLNKVVKHKI